jgi:hypothetical protein
MGYKASSPELQEAKCKKEKSNILWLRHRSLASAYPLVDGNWCVDEDARLIRYAGLFLFIFSGRFLEIVDLCLSELAEKMQTHTRAAYLSQRRSHRRDEEAVTSLNPVSMSMSTSLQP